MQQLLLGSAPGVWLVRAAPSLLLAPSGDRPMAGPACPAAHSPAKRMQMEDNLVPSLLASTVLAQHKHSSHRQSSHLLLELALEAGELAQLPPQAGVD